MRTSRVTLARRLAAGFRPFLASLLSGTCLAGHGLAPALKIYACEPRGALDAICSVRENRIVPMPNPRTIAEGLRTSLGTLTPPILREHLEDVSTTMIDTQLLKQGGRGVYSPADRLDLDGRASDGARHRLTRTAGFVDCHMDGKILLGVQKPYRISNIRKLNEWR